MATQLMLLPYLQQWDGTQLSLRLLAAPQFSPLDPLAPGEPAFVDADFKFEVRLIQGLAAIPATATAFTPVVVDGSHPPQARTICQVLQANLPIDPTITPVNPRTSSARFMKYAPPPYRAASGYAEGRNPFVTTTDAYHCALKSPPAVGTVLKSDPPKLSWGKTLAACLRQPLLSQSTGLVRPYAITPPAHFFDNGGWIYVSLVAGSPGSSLLATLDALKVYAARVPPLHMARSLFTCALFPVEASPPSGNYDDLFREVVDYDDGFAKIVYTNQPSGLDPMNEVDDGSRPADEHGVRLGWDDEQVATWLNRQIDPVSGLDAPLGIFGYRIDARHPGDANWSSLELGTTSVTIGATALGTWSGEFQTEIAPHKLMGDTSINYWIPSYYTTWNGASLAGLDPIAAMLKGITPSTAVTGDPLTLPLLYGKDYEFRVRLVDHTRGGPSLGEDPSNPAPQPVAPLTFLRWVRPGPLRLDTIPPVEPDPTNPTTQLSIRRPRLGYPAYIYAGGAAADLIADLPNATAGNRAVGLPDPDVSQVQVEVQVQCPGEDTGFRTLYVTTRPFPAGPDDPLTLDLDWIDVANTFSIAAPASGAIKLPTARRVRVNLSAVAANKPNYYGADDVRTGQATQMLLADNSQDEKTLLTATSLLSSSEAIMGIFLQSDINFDATVAAAQKSAGQGLATPENSLGRLASALDVEPFELGLRAKPGDRVLFGCSPALRNAIGPDGASIRFTTLGDITRHWVVAIRLDLNRDWAWDGLSYLVVERDGTEVGRLWPHPAVSQEALSPPRRDRSNLVFLDAIDPKPPAGSFPAELNLNYKVTPVFRATPASFDPPRTFALHLPITTPPSQIPKLASVGLAQSAYSRDADYTTTDARTKMLWFEFDQPVQDPHDLYFGRVLAVAPDPALTDAADTPDLAEPPLPIDPEPIRVITPGQSDDEAGLNAMQPMLSTNSPRHFLLPIPSGYTADSPELFGFFTYEFRVGHDIGWTTAQGRFGRPLRVTGVQHPAPTLICSVVRRPSGFEASAPFAKPVLNTVSVQPMPPLSEMWFLLYAQVHQADDADRRNLLLSRRQGFPIRQKWRFPGQGDGALSGTATWSQEEIYHMLQGFQLDTHTPLSCIAVETLPGTEPNVDPLGVGLGYERFLRTSPLTPLPAQC
jgi:hypothetical protein